MVAVNTDRPDVLALHTIFLCLCNGAVSGSAGCAEDAVDTHIVPVLRLCFRKFGFAPVVGIVVKYLSIGEYRTNALDVAHLELGDGSSGNSADESEPRVLDSLFLGLQRSCQPYEVGALLLRVDELQDIRLSHPIHVYDGVLLIRILGSYFAQGVSPGETGDHDQVIPFIGGLSEVRDVHVLSLCSHYIIELAAVGSILHGIAIVLDDASPRSCVEGLVIDSCCVREQANGRSAVGSRNFLAALGEERGCHNQYNYQQSYFFHGLPSLWLVRDACNWYCSTTKSIVNEEFLPYWERIWHSMAFAAPSSLFDAVVVWACALTSSLALSMATARPAMPNIGTSLRPSPMTMRSCSA